MSVLRRLPGYLRGEASCIPNQTREFGQILTDALQLVTLPSPQAVQMED
jgi:hypothetical protein